MTPRTTTYSYGVQPAATDNRTSSTSAAGKSKMGQFVAAEVKKVLKCP